MKPSRFLLVFIFITTLKIANAQTAYEKEMQAWQEKRIKALTADNGWINLAGLFWLEKGKNSFGSDKTNAIVFEHNNMPATAGYFELGENNKVTWHSAAGVNVTINNQPADGQVIFPYDTTGIKLSALGSLRWNIIKRENKIGVRLRDLQHPALQNFHGAERFVLDTTLKITGKLIQPVSNSIAIKNILGQTSEEKTAGKLSFSIAGKNYTLDALDEGGDDLFIIFGDETNKETTYPSGRFLYVKKPGTDGKVIIDFNKAINPPCAFTKFATCPLPPPQNILPIAIEAGEKDYGHY